MLEDNLIEKLRTIREELKIQYPDFPKDLCANAAQIIKEELGLKRYSGFYYVNGVGNGTGIAHHWPCDERKRILEIATDQFDETVPEVEIISPNNPRYQRYDFRWCLDPDD